MPDYRFAKDIHDEFRIKPECQFIASRFAIFSLAKFLSTHSISSALEIGAGIGTITKLLLTHHASPGTIISIEETPLCLTELEKNLANCDKRHWKLVNRISEIDKNVEFDLVIFDGILDPVNPCGFIKEGTWCFVEGNRIDTRTALARHLEKSGLTVELKSAYPRSPKIRITSGRSFLGISLPRFQVVRRKGCHIGQVHLLN
jgi:hypothetical protein